MNRIAKRLATAGLLALLSCSGSSATSLPPQILAMSYTLQGVLADAVTGARLGGDIKLFLVQGATVRGPERLITGTTDPLMGEYAFTGIPVAFNSGNNIWKVVAVKTGYQRFESEITFTVANTDSGTIVDSVYSKIGNIFMFPLGVTAPDYNFTVTYNGKPVPGATVELDPEGGSNSGKFVETESVDTLSQDTGYIPGIQSTPTDATGKVTIAGADLVLGGAYKVSALPVQFSDTAGTKVQLGLTFATGTLMVGLAGNDVNRSIAMSDLSPGSGSTPIYITNATNLPQGQIQADGKLTITFNAPVAAPYLGGWTAALDAGTQSDGTAGKGVLSATAPATATLSADGLTLTLAPNYGSPAPLATDRGVSITYSNGPPAGATSFVGIGVVEPKDYPAEAFVLFTPGGSSTGITQLTFGDGSTHDSGTVVISAP